MTKSEFNGAVRTVKTRKPDNTAGPVYVKLLIPESVEII